MKRLAIGISLFLTVAGLSGAQRKIAFERGDNVWIANLDGSDAKKVAAGSLPNISPDATRLAFNTNEDSKTRPGPERHIAIADLASGKVTVLKDIPSDNCFGPVWSPDGKGMNGNDRLSVSPDGKTLLMDVDLGAEHERKNWDGPQPAVYVFDFDTEKTSRVTAKDDFVWDPYWVTNDEFLCVIQKEHEKEPSLYRMSISGKNAKLLAKHARTPSVSAP
jgi:Tol biopolymer transport system component